MKVCCVADLHGSLPPDVPECDLLLIAGDIAGNLSFVRGPFADWLARQPAGEIVGVGGNTDTEFEALPIIARELPWIYLDHDVAVVDDQVIYGTPRTPWHIHMAFESGESEAAERYARIPDDTTILLSHGPPQGCSDLTHSGLHVGSPALLERAEELPNLRLIACGHIHEARGVSYLPGSGVPVVNCAMRWRDDPPFLLDLAGERVATVSV